MKAYWIRFRALSALLPALALLLSLTACTIEPGHVDSDTFAQMIETQPSEQADTSFKEPEAPEEEETEPEAVPTLLPETEDAGQSYVDGTLFIGDSNTARYILNGYVTLANAIGVVGMGAGSMLDLPCVQFEGEDNMVTLPEAVVLMQPSRVVFGYGTNNLTESCSDYIAEYEEAIQAIYDCYPYFDVIVNAVPPVTADTMYDTVSMSAIDTFNAALLEMCERHGWHFLNSYEALLDESTGYLNTAYADGDGLHLSDAGDQAVFTYFRTHAYITEDLRPKPLEEIPEHVEAPYEPITGNPLS